MSVKKFFDKNAPLKALEIFLCLCIAFLTVYSGVKLVQKKYLYPLKYKEEIIFYCVKYDLDKALVFSVVNVESGFNKDAQSNRGAKGLMQITDGTAEYLAGLMQVGEYDLFNVNDNLNIGCYYLRYLLNKFDNTLVALSAYNAGEGNVAKWLKEKRYSVDGKILTIIPYEETANYVKKIEKSLDKYRNLYGKIVDK